MSSTDGEAGVSRCGWFSHVAMFSCSMAGFSSLYVTQSLGPELRRLHGLSVEQSASLLTATTLGLAFASPVFGPLLQRFGLRRMALAGLVTLALLDAGLAVAETFPALLALRIAQGAALPMLLSALLASIERQPSSDAAMGISATYVMGTICGGVLGRLLPATLVPAFGWSPAFVAMAASHVAALLLAAKGFRDASMRATVLVQSSPRNTDNPTLAVVYVGGFAALFSQMAVFTYIPFRLAAPPFDWDTSALGHLYLIFLPALAFVRGSRRVVTKFGHVRAATIAAVCAWCGLLTTLADTPALLIVGLALFSIAVFFVQAVLAHALSVAPAASRERASSGYLFFYYLGGSLGAIAPAVSWTDFGWPGCLCLVGVLQLTSFVLSQFVRVPVRVTA